MPGVKDNFAKPGKTAAILSVCCYKTFWRRRWRYYLKHGDGRDLVYSWTTFPDIKEMMRDIVLVRGKNNWPIEFAHSTISAEQLADIQHEIAEPKTSPKK